MNGPNAQAWRDAAQKEIDTLSERKTWDLVQLPPGRKPIGCKWVFKTKFKSDGTVDRYKARLVAKGFSQRAGIDYTETFSPVVKVTSVRVLLALAAHFDYDADHMDATSAFLYGKIDEELYMRQPEGFTEKDKEDLVCRLRLGLYGLVQSSRAFNSVLHDYLVSIDFKRCVSDPCVYVRRSGPTVTYLAVYVDDLLIVSNNQAERARLKAELHRRFEMSDLGPLEWFLGIRVVRDQDGIHIDQSQYLKTSLTRFGMDKAKPSPTPARAGLHLTKHQGAVNNNFPYREIVGTLMYASVGSRPDLAHAVATCARHVSSHSAAHDTAVKRVLRYVNGTTDHRITYHAEHDLTLTGHCDSDWANNPDDRRSVTGWVFHLSGGPISWASRVQRSVALSTVEAEYMAIADAARECLWLRSLLRELGHDLPTTTIFEDNQGCIALSENAFTKKRSKHIDIRYHFVRECVQRGDFKLVYKATADMIADLLTKPLSPAQFKKLLSKLLGL